MLKLKIQKMNLALLFAFAVASVAIGFAAVYLLQLQWWFLVLLASICVAIGAMLSSARAEPLESYRALSLMPRTKQNSNEKNRSGSSHDLPIAILTIENGGFISNPNSAACSLLCIKEDERVELSELVEGLGRPVSGWIAEMQAGASTKHVEFASAKRSSDETYLQIQLIKDGDQILAILLDATEIKTLEAQFVQNQKMQAIGQLAGGIAHDFNNLLTAISGYCDLLLLRHEKGDADHSDLVQISNNANRAAFLVSHLLAFSRKQTLKSTAVQINDTLSDMTHLLNRLVGELITFNLDQAKDLPRVYADTRQLEQVIMNLVVNARDAMPNGGKISLKSELSKSKKSQTIDGVVLQPGIYVVIKVIDEGTGMPASVKERIFEPFFTTKEVGKGTGLGLSMAYGIMKQMGGYIFVDSKMGVGTTFTLYLRANEQIEDREIVLPQPIQRKLGNLSGLRVLLVEDEDPVLAVSTRALKSQGVIIETAQNGRDALALLEKDKKNFDVVVTDVVMPGMDGPTWVERAMQDGLNAKIIFVSGYAKETLSDKWNKIENAMFLPKPYSLKDLIDTVAAASDREKEAA
ncbi:MAG: ATP-binding protein [Pseudomonadota bacterium]